jgi:hypothetical protein
MEFVPGEFERRPMKLHDGTWKYPNSVDLLKDVGSKILPPILLFVGSI